LAANDVWCIDFLWFVFSSKKPEPTEFEYGPWQVAGFLMVGTTLWMSSIEDLPPVAYDFYLMYSRATILVVV
jgi:hypothetical protein